MTKIGKLQSGPVRHVVEEKSELESESLVEEVIFHVGVKQKSPPYEVKVDVDDCDVRMEVDTGSSVSLVSQATYERLWSKLELSPCKY